MFNFTDDDRKIIKKTLQEPKYQKWKYKNVQAYFGMSNDIKIDPKIRSDCKVLCFGYCKYWINKKNITIKDNLLLAKIATSSLLGDDDIVFIAQKKFLYFFINKIRKETGKVPKGYRKKMKKINYLYNLLIIKYINA